MTGAGYSDEDIERLLDEKQTPTGELYRILGESLGGNEGFGTNVVAAGKAAIRNINGRVKRDVCPRLAEPRFRRLIDSSSSADLISLVAVLASIISTWGMALNATLVAVLLIRLGLRTVCPNLG